MPAKPVTIKEIAKLLEVSTSTVSRALHDHPSIGLATTQKVKKLAKELQYERNQTAIFFQQGRTYTIGVILPELSEAFFSAAISAIEDTAYKRNYTVLLAQSHDDELKEKQLVEKMKHHRVDGLLVSISKNTSSFEHFNSLSKYNIPVVFFDRIPALDNIHSVSCNLETGTVEAVSYLLKKGHRAIGMINGPDTLFASKQRREGYIKAMLKNRLKFDPSLLVNCDLTEVSTQKALDELLANRRKVTAVVTFNDYVWLYAMQYARKLGIRINEELEYVSYANLPITSYMSCAPLASVEQFPYQQGQKATEILLDLLNSREKEPKQQAYYNVLVESQLVDKQGKDQQLE
ncbi:LacI family DNA-binding transcriptional regulator [Pontibacter ramchanderi]|uniref:LacI family transcriptional regulator n=1 Tax=Pontibacter ramchanderi TaxID=1179743 RepID=A0A2N3U871_9BACT|nr:LacI family DNA-binding transcriptional regulator [Pontibacter ramchanderi]PKV62915.1 LacI family transcriptional regulator [Pontibacter ramchanderi]